MSLEGLEALRQRFRARAREDLLAVQAWATAGLPHDPDTERRVHNLAGAAGAFGYPRLNAAAAALDDAIAVGETPSLSDVEGLMTALDQMDSERAPEG